MLFIFTHQPSEGNAINATHVVSMKSELLQTNTHTHKEQQVKIWARTRIKIHISAKEIKCNGECNWLLVAANGEQQLCVCVSHRHCMRDYETKWIYHLCEADVFCSLNNCFQFENQFSTGNGIVSHLFDLIVLLKWWGIRPAVLVSARCTKCFFGFSIFHLIHLISNIFA